MKSIYTLIFLFILSISNAQLNESFENNVDKWTGQLEKFKLSKGQLMLNDNTAGSTQLFTKNNLIYAEWIITLRLAFAPSATNKLTIYLAADTNQTALIKNGYYLELGENGNADAFQLVKLINGIKTTLLRGLEIYGTEKDSISIKVTHQPDGTWQLFADPTGVGNYTLENSMVNNDITSTTYFGFRCDYTVTRAASFYFSEMSIKKYIPDVVGPKVIENAITNNQSIRVQFNESILFDSLSTENIRLENSRPVSVKSINNRSVEISFQEIVPNTPLLLSIHNMYDLSGNKSDTAFTILFKKDTIPPQLTQVKLIDLARARLQFSEPLLTDSLTTNSFLINNTTANSFEILSSTELIITFDPIKTNTSYPFELKKIYDEALNSVKYFATEIQLDALQPHDLVISEILYDPIAGTNGEFIELYNRTDKTINTSEIKFAKGYLLEGAVVVESIVNISEPINEISPNGYRVFTELNTWNTIPPNVTHTKIPILNNDGTTIILLNQFNEVIDYVSYDKLYHSPSSKKTKGISLEKIDNDIQNEKSNWTSASSLVKNTPGEVNSAHHPFEFKTTLTIAPKQLDFNYGETSFLFSYAFEQEKSGNCILFNEKGQKLVDILNNEHLASQGIFTWSPSDSYNITTGNYIIVWETWDNLGNRKTEKYVVSIIR